MLSQDGRVGVVERVGYRSSHADAAFLLVRGGLLRASMVVIDAADVLEVRPERSVVRLRRGYRATPVECPPGAVSRLLHQMIPTAVPGRAHP